MSQAFLTDPFSLLQQAFFDKQAFLAKHRLNGKPVLY